MSAPKRLVGALALVVALVALIATAAPAGASAPPGTPTASSFDGTPTVGAIFRDGLDSDHGCTGSVLASPSRDLVLTAAHCVFGTAAGWQFVPGYDDGRTPYGVWTVQHAYVDPSWLTSQDPQHDYAILQVAAQKQGGHTVRLQDVTGGNVLGLAPRAGTTITDVAYNEGIDDQPIHCTTTAYLTTGYPTFNCHGYVGGSSGSPWLTSIGHSGIGIVHGVIGGLHQGGCFEYTSYSSAFTPSVYALLLRATLGIHPDTVPEPGSDGC